MEKKLKKDIKPEFKEIFSKLMYGTREEYKEAKKRIEKLWHSETKTFKTTAPIALEYLPQFEKIQKTENQAAFASGLSLFFLSLGDEHFETLKDFTLKVIQHPHGHVREAILKTADWLYVSLSSRTEPFVYPEGKELNEEQKTIQTQAREQFINFAKEIENLMDKYDDEKENVEYIDEMKPSVNKSLQFLWARLTDSPVYRRIIEQSRPIPMDIFIKRKEIEREIEELLKKTKSAFDLEEIKQLIYNENGQDSLTEIIAIFDTGQGAVELQNVIESVNDAWNYFPHKILEGLSPTEKYLEYKQKEAQE